MSTHTTPNTTRLADSTATYRPTLDDPPASDSSHAPDAVGSWVARCQAQFDTHRTDRLGNLVDEENQAIPTVSGRDRPDHP